MSTEVGTEPAGSWYGDARVDATDVLDALRRYRSAEAAARRRARDSLGIGENAMVALRILIAARKAGRTVNAKELAERLAVTAASTSALVDRLVRSGHVRRLPDPTDRRGVLLSATDTSMHRALEVIASLDEHTIDVAERLSPDDAAVVVAFLGDIADVTGPDAVEHDGTEHGATGHDGTEHGITERDATERGLTERDATERGLTERDATAHSRRVRGPGTVAGSR